MLAATSNRAAEHRGDRDHLDRACVALGTLVGLFAPVGDLCKSMLKHAYRAAFNNAYDRYGGDGERRAHRIAWAAVKRSYQKVGDAWVPKNVDYWSAARSTSR